MSLFRSRSSVLESRYLLSSASIPLNSEGYWNASGRAVTTDSALRNGAVYSCVGLIADALSTTPIDVYRKQADGRRVNLATPAVLDRPDGAAEMVEWLFSFFASLVLRGNTYGMKDSFDEFGYPREIHLMHPDDVTVTRSNDDSPPVYRFNGVEVPTRRVLHVKGFTLPGCLVGLSPIQLHAQSIGMGLAAEEYGARFFGDGAHPTAVLETEQAVSQEQADTIKSRVLSVLRGRREPIVLGAGVKWNQIQVPPSDSMFLDTIRATTNEIARIFHVPVEKIGGASEGNSITYGNREANVIEFQTDALLPNAVRFEQHMSRLLPGKQYVKFNMDAAIRVDLKTRYEAHQIGIATGLETVDEARELEDRPPLTDAQAAALAVKQAPTMPAPAAPMAARAASNVMEPAPDDLLLVADGLAHVGRAVSDISAVMDQQAELLAAGQAALKAMNRPRTRVIERDRDGLIAAIVEE